MNKTLIPALLVLSSTFVACGLIPAQTVKNPVGLQGQKVSVPLAAPTAARKGLTPALASVGSAGSFSGSASFADSPDLSQLPLNPSKFTVDLDFSGASFSGCTPTFPNSVTVEVAGAKVVVKDAAAQATVTFGTSSVVLTKTGATTYSVGTPTPALSSDVDNVVNLVKVLKEGGQNTATVTGKINTDKAELQGCTLELTFGEGKGTINF